MLRTRISQMRADLDNRKQQLRTETKKQRGNAKLMQLRRQSIQEALNKMRQHYNDLTQLQLDRRKKLLDSDLPTTCIVLDSTRKVLVRELFSLFNACESGSFLHFHAVLAGNIMDIAQSKTWSNALISYTVHFISILSSYLNCSLPFHITYVRSRPHISTMYSQTSIYDSMAIGNQLPLVKSSSKRHSWYTLTMALLTFNVKMLAGNDSSESNIWIILNSIYQNVQSGLLVDHERDSKVNLQDHITMFLDRHLKYTQDLAFTQFLAMYQEDYPFDDNVVLVEGQPLDSQDEDDDDDWDVLDRELPPVPSSDDVDIDSFYRLHL